VVVCILVNERKWLKEKSFGVQAMGEPAACHWMTACQDQLLAAWSEVTCTQYVHSTVMRTQVKYSQCYLV